VKPCHSHELSVLVQANSPKIHAYCCAIGNAISDRLACFDHLINFGLQNPDHAGVQQLLPLVQKASITYSCANIDLYDTIYSSPWAAHVEIEEQHLEISKAITKWVKTPNENQTGVNVT
jgi:hypothetical protein